MRHVKIDITLGTMTGVFFLNNTFLSPFSWNGIEFSLHEFVSLFTDGFTARVGIISTYLIFLIPILSIIYLGLRFIFKFKTKNKYIGVYAGSLWMVSLMVLIGSAIKISYGMRSTEEISQSYQINNPDTDTLYINLFDSDHIDRWNDKSANFGSVLVDMDDDKLTLKGQPKLDIIKSENGKTSIKIVRKSDGMNKDEALKFAKNIKYEWQQMDSAFYFRRFFNIEGKQKVKDQELDIEFEIPVGKVLYFGENIDYITSNIEIMDGFWEDNYTKQYWIMTEDGLKSLNDNKKDFKDENKDNKGTSDTIKVMEPSNQQEIEDMKKELDAM